MRWDFMYSHIQKQARLENFFRIISALSLSLSHTHTDIYIYIYIWQRRCNNSTGPFLVHFYKQNYRQPAIGAPLSDFEKNLKIHSLNPVPGYTLKYIDVKIWRGFAQFIFPVRIFTDPAKDNMNSAKRKAQKCRQAEGSFSSQPWWPHTHCKTKRQAVAHFLTHSKNKFVEIKM
jgi:hypothetical protein